MDELNFTGNCLKGSRPILSFDAAFDTEPHLQLIKSLSTQIFGVPPGARKSKPFIDRVMGDPRLNANPRVDEAHHRVSPQGFKYYVTEMLCWAAGGPQTYSGRTMGDSHRHLMITDEEWVAFMDDLQQSLDKFEVPQPEQDEVTAIIESTKEAIVVEPLQEGPVEVS